MKINDYAKDLRMSRLTTAGLRFMRLGIIGLAINYGASANPFATPNLTSSPYTCPANPNNAKDPANHKMYTVAVNYRPYAPQSSQKLIWAAGTESKSFTFDSNKNITISFTELVDEINASTNPFFGEGRGPGPSYGTYNSGNENTVDAINTRHGNTVGQNHILNLQVNRNVSKIGYKIQDVDSEGNSYVRYQQRVDVSPNGGIFNLSFNTALQNINSDNNIITAVALQECSLGQCVIDASWRYTAANNKVRLRHSNIEKDSIAYDRSHIVGYSDFYFCLAPPKIVVKKALDGARIIDTGNNSDQFEISVNENATPLGSFKTTGSGATVTNDSSSTITLAEGKIYTITEQVKNGETLGDIANYDATYTCTNATTGTAVNLSSGAMTYNATTKTRSFGLSDLKYGDEVTCTITNTPKSYTFSGTVFNDNGGITSPDSELVGGIYSNANFFNGTLDTNETGIDGMNIVQARLSDCSNNANPIIATSNVTNLGKYSFSVLSKDLKGKSDLCIEEIEPKDWLYSVDTTPNIRKFSFNPAVLNYKTGVEINGNKLNFDFGNVIKENTALVLVKSQYVHDCSLKDLTTIGVNYNGLPTAAFSKQPIAEIEPGQCIAYRIEAINRGNIPITDIVIRDTLQKSGEGGAFATSTLSAPDPIGENGGVPTFPTDSVAIGSNGKVITNRFDLGTTTTSNNRKAIRFNTKYGSVNDK